MSSASSGRTVLGRGRRSVPRSKHSAFRGTPGWHLPCTRPRRRPCMVSRLGCVTLAVCAMLAASARPAQAQQTLNFTFGYFTVKGEDARVDRDILTTNLNSFVFDVSDFNSATVGGEYL